MEFDFYEHSAQYSHLVLFEFSTILYVLMAGIMWCGISLTGAAAK